MTPNYNIIGDTMTKEIKVYSSPRCPYCVRLQKLLEDADIPYIYVDVSDPDERQKMAEKSGAMGIPQVEFVNGDKEIITDYGTEEDVVKEVQEYLAEK